MNPMVLLVALAAFMPTADPQKICQSARAAALPEEQAGAFQSCVRDEEGARDQLKQRWSQFSAAARAACAEPAGIDVSYVEMLTCLEMQTGSNFATGISPPAAAPPSPAQTAPPAAAPKP